jgi:Uma2 family endonuclease
MLAFGDFIFLISPRIIDECIGTTLGTLLGLYAENEELHVEVRDVLHTAVACSRYPDALYLCSF